MELTINEKAKTVTITLPLATFTSKSGKSLMLASTRGNIDAGVEFKGKAVIGSVNVYVKA